MIDLLSLIPLLQTAPAVSSDLSATVGQDFSALLNELVAPAEQSDLQPANPIALLDRETAGLVESAGTKTPEKAKILSPANLLAPLPSALFFESPIPSPDLAPGPQPAVPQVKADEHFTRAVLDDLKKFELTVHYEIADSVQSVSKQAIVTSDPIANIRQPQLVARFVETQQPSKVTPEPQFIQPSPQLIKNVVADLLRKPSVFLTASNGQERLSAVETAPTVREEKPVGASLPSRPSPPSALAATVLSRRVLTEFTKVQLVEPGRTLSAIAPEQPEPPASPLITTDPIARLALPRSSALVIPILQTTGDIKTPVKGFTAAEIKTQVKGLTAAEIETPVKGLTAAEIKTQVKGLTAAEIKTQVKGLPAAEIKTPVKGLTAAEIETPVRGLPAADVKSQLKAPTAPAPTHVLMLQRTSEPEPVQTGIVQERSFVLDSAVVDSPESLSQDSPRSRPILKDVKELDVKPRAITLLPGEERILETTEEAPVTAVSSESDLEELPLSRGILSPKALVNAKQSDPDRADSGVPKFSDSGSSAPVMHFENRSRSVDAVEQPRQAHWVEIPHMPKLQVVRTVSMELGDAGSEVAVRIQERDGAMTLHFGTGNDSLQHTIESSVGVLVHALKQEQIQLSNVEVTRKSPIDKVRRMKEAHNGHR